MRFIRSSHSVPGLAFAAVMVVGCTKLTEVDWSRIPPQASSGIDAGGSAGADGGDAGRNRGGDGADGVDPSAGGTPSAGGAGSAAGAGGASGAAGAGGDS